MVFKLRIKNSLQFHLNVLPYGSSAVAVLFDIMNFGSRGGRQLSYLTFSFHDSEQARGGRGGFQRDVGPPDQVLGIYSHKYLLSTFEFGLTNPFS